MEELLKYLISQVADKTENIKVETTEENNNVVVLKALVNKEDLGRVIGKGGKVANSIRTIVKTASQRTGKRYIIKIEEDK